MAPVVARVLVLIAPIAHAARVGPAAQSLVSCTRAPVARRSSVCARAGEEPASVSVADLGLTMADLETPMNLADPGAGVKTSGQENTSGVAGASDMGCAWEEDMETVRAALTIPGLRGQPAAAMDVDITETTTTITVFGRGIWSCVLRGTVDPSSARVAITEEAMQPTVTITLKKADAGGDDGTASSMASELTACSSNS
eukprot:CAMPEP_0185551720 /NCGR_PEP_ID=MMETSP1381-20130426/29055_1 /TAXON_ID=298111 /ORGANISM="Pavlova sp., Strain CCMP459" /LENGTH=198 /DNA_ID=CAMNT_0028164617 /DNA_START=13 /DNA_END=606 /DNA_ORIENTATION=+